MSIQVKICGTQTVEDARAAARAGADLLGFIFYPSSPRAVTVGEVARIVAALRGELGDQAPRMVGVFVDEPPAEVRRKMAEADLELAQLHGSEPPLELRALLPHAYKAIRPRSRGDGEGFVATYARDLVDAPGLPHFLVDSPHPSLLGGSGMVGNWAIPELLARHHRILLAGGLTPATVAAAIDQVRPWGVDVVSGVEKQRGVKDHAKISAFVAAVREAEQRQQEALS